jgi:membrane protease YdiL (CAAX protease family)
MKSISAEQKSGWILFGIAATEGTWVAMNWLRNGERFTRYLGFAPGLAGRWKGWVAAAVVTIAFVRVSIRLPSVRQNFLRPSGLKLLGLAVAFAAGILEEVIFRKWIMDYLLGNGFGSVVQVVAAAVTFGLLHGIWGLFGRSVRIATGATIATGALGAALAIVYLTAGRSLAPCVVTHFVVNALIEPGLVLAACRGEMARQTAAD